MVLVVSIAFAVSLFVSERKKTQMQPQNPRRAASFETFRLTTTIRQEFFV